MSKVIYVSWISLKELRLLLDAGYMIILRGFKCTLKR